MVNTRGRHHSFQTRHQSHDQSGQRPGVRSNEKGDGGWRIGGVDERRQLDHAGWVGWDGPHVGKGPKGYRRSDDRIREEISDRLMEHSDIDASEIEIDVKDGEVTLTGTVESRQAKRMTEDIVEESVGVTHVSNQLRVDNGSRGRAHARAHATPSAAQCNTGAAEDRHRAP